MIESFKNTFCKKQKYLFLLFCPYESGIFVLLAMNSAFLWSRRLLLYRMALFLLKAQSPSWDISPLNQLWDLIDGADFLVGLCGLKK